MGKLHQQTILERSFFALSSLFSSAEKFYETSSERIAGVYTGSNLDPLPTNMTKITMETVTDILVTPRHKL